jgi:hypothetical protein
MGDDEAERPAVPVSHWMRRSTPEEDRERGEVGTSIALVQFYVLIPLVVVAALLPAGLPRGIAVTLVIGGYCVWLVLRSTRAWRWRRREAGSAADAPPGSGTPPAAPGT